MKAIYKITKPGHPGALYVMYRDGFIQEAIFSFDVIPDEDFQCMLYDYFPFFEQQLSKIKLAGCEFQELKPRTVADKISMFCLAFKERFKVAYNAKKTEKANLKDVQVTADLLTTYFNNTTYPLTTAKNITDYIRHYNYIRQITANPEPVKKATRFPDVYERDFERMLDGEGLAAYWQHLRELGWKKLDGVWRSPEELKA